MMKKRIIIISVICVLACAVIGLILFNVNHNPKELRQETDKISECIITAEELQMNVGQVPEDMLENYLTIENDRITLTDFDNIKADEYKLTFKNELQNVCNEGITNRIASQYDDNLDFIISLFEKDDPEEQTVDVTLDSGVLDFNITKLKTENDKVIADTEFVTWDVRIVEENNCCNVNMTMSKDIVSYELAKSKDNWIITDNSQITQLFAPDDYEYTKGSFATIPEALDFAQTLNAEEENPF